MEEEKTFTDIANIKEGGNKTQNNSENNTRNRRNGSGIGIWKILVVVLTIVCIALLIAVICLAVINGKEPSENQTNGQTDKQVDTKVPKCSGQAGVIDLSEQSEPSMFSDLTSTEVKGLADFIYSNDNLNLVRPDKAAVTANYVYTAEIYIPNKRDAVDYLDGATTQKPPREAKVTIFRGNQTVPEIQEIIVTPLPSPTSYRVLRDKIPFIFRPITGPEYNDVKNFLKNKCTTTLSDMLLESYGGKLTPDCGSKCLSFDQITTLSPVLSGEDKRKIWFWLMQFAEFFVLHPVDFAILVEIDGANYSVEKVWYNGKTFDTMETLKQQYHGGQISKQVVPFPEDSSTLFSKMTKRGVTFPKKEQRPPMQVEADGKRYSIQGRSVTYMDWAFDFRMSSTQGPQLYDIRYQNQRIAFEHGLQEVSVFYSGYRPVSMFANVIDSIALMGAQAKGMVPGMDCPAHATFIPAFHVVESSEDLAFINNALCIFEQDTGMPIRRHNGFDFSQGMFYEGSPNTVLILRTMITVANYDYIMDFVFYQNGVLETKVISTGYILATPFSNEEKPFGAQVHRYISGNIHHHMFHFKSDLDINGMNNRYDTLDLTTTQTPNNFNVNPNAKQTQARFDYLSKSTEKAAAYKYNFDTPKYHIFYSNSTRNEFGNPKAYRVAMRGMSKQILPEGVGMEPAVSWMRYQMAVTKRKEDERASSSVYAAFDARNPVVNFQSFIDDNESLVDEVSIVYATLFYMKYIKIHSSL